MTGDLITGAEHWRRIRRLLNEHRLELAALAAGLYPDLPRVAGTDLLCWPGWLPAAPLDLADLRLGWVSAPPPPAADGTGEAAAHVPPRSRPGWRTRRTRRIEALNRPALFENRVCYRLLDADLGGAGLGAADRASPPRLRFGPSRYFDAVNLGHAVAHELAAAWAAPGPPPDRPDLDWADLDRADLDGAALPLRASVGDPCALPRRSALTAVTTLTLRRAPGGAASFLLHWRDPARVNHAGGLYQVMPAGIFQPVSAAGRAAPRPEPVAVHDPGVQRGTAGRVGAVPHPWWATRLRAVAVPPGAGRRPGSWHPAGQLPRAGGQPAQRWPRHPDRRRLRSGVFDRMFRRLVTENAEGRVVTQDGSAAIPFTQATVDRFTSGAEPLQTAGAALLRLAWQHRGVLGISG